MRRRGLITDRVSREWRRLDRAMSPSEVDCECWGRSQQRPLSGVQGCAGDLSRLCGSVCKATQGMKARQGEGCQRSQIHFKCYSGVRTVASDRPTSCARPPLDTPEWLGYRSR